MQSTHNSTPPSASFLEVREITEGYKSIYAAQDLAAGTVLINFGYEAEMTTPTRHSLQVGENHHISLSPAYLKYLNHSCEPNIFVDTNRKALISTKKIAAGEELTFFYPSTEWQMTEAFTCGCGSENCLNTIQGAAYLTYDQLVKYKLSDYVIQKYASLAAIQAKQFPKA